jgi:emp24/gp25L/p24 family/GOLD
MVRIPPLSACVLSFTYSTDVVAPIEREIRLLAHGLTSVKDEQEYIVVRERTHRNTAESTNSRVKWWSILQTIVLFSVVAWQVYYLKVRLITSYLSIATQLTQFRSPSSRSRGSFRVVLALPCPSHILHIYSVAKLREDSVHK